MRVLDFGRIFDADRPFEEGGVTLVVANWALPSCLPALWRRASFRIAADGGANRLYDELPALFPELSAAEVRARHVPDLVVGDGDSLRADVASFYEAAGCVVLPPSADQDTTDLHKAVAAALRRPSCGWLVAVGCLGGRLDHTLAALSLLHDASLPTTDAPFTLVGESSSATLLRPGAHELAPWREVEGPKCGLVPLVGPAVVTASGLQWPMDARRLEMGVLVSTSNALVDAGAGEPQQPVRVTTDAPVVWTTQLRRLRPPSGADATRRQ